MQFVCNQLMSMLVNIAALGLILYRLIISSDVKPYNPELGFLKEKFFVTDDVGTSFWLVGN